MLLVIVGIGCCWCFDARYMVEYGSVIYVEDIQGFSHCIRLVIDAINVIDRYLGELEVCEGIEDGAE